MVYFVNLWPESVQWLLSPQSLTQGSSWMQNALGMWSREAGVLDTGVTTRLQNRSSQWWESLQSCVSEEKGSRPWSPDSFLPPLHLGNPLGDLVSCFPSWWNRGLNWEGTFLSLIVGFCFSHLKLPGAENKSYNRNSLNCKEKKFLTLDPIIHSSL